jgi:hypothetical protein
VLSGFKQTGGGLIFVWVELPAEAQGVILITNANRFRLVVNVTLAAINNGFESEHQQAPFRTFISARQCSHHSCLGSPVKRTVLCSIQNNTILITADQAPGIQKDRSLETSAGCFTEAQWHGLFATNSISAQDICDALGFRSSEKLISIEYPHCSTDPPRE